MSMIVVAGGEGPRVGVGVPAHERGHGAVAAVGRDARPARHPAQLELVPAAAGRARGCRTFSRRAERAGRATGRCRGRRRSTRARRPARRDGSAGARRQRRPGDVAVALRVARGRGVRKTTAPRGGHRRAADLGPSCAPGASAPGSCRLRSAASDDRRDRHAARATHGREQHAPAARVDGRLRHRPAPPVPAHERQSRRRRARPAGRRRSTTIAVLHAERHPEGAEDHRRHQPRDARGGAEHGERRCRARAGGDSALPIAISTPSVAA